MVDVREGTPVQRDEMVRRIVSAAAADPTIVGLVDYGSSSEGRSDEWSDIDIAVFVRDDAHDDFVRSWKEWAAQFGELLLAYIGRYRHPWAVYASAPAPVRVDFDVHRESAAPRISEWENSPTSVETMVLYDATGGVLASAARPLVGKSLRPYDDHVAFDAACGDFWYFTLFVHAKLRRGEVWVARQVFQSEVMDQLFHLLRLEAGDRALDRWEWEKNAYGVERTVSPERLRQLEQCVAGPAADGVSSALAAAAALATEVCASIADREHWPWPKRLAAQTRVLLS